MALPFALNGETKCPRNPTSVTFKKCRSLLRHWVRISSRALLFAKRGDLLGVAARDAINWSRATTWHYKNDRQVEWWNSSTRLSKPC